MYYKTIFTNIYFIIHMLCSHAFLDIIFSVIMFKKMFWGILEYFGNIMNNDKNNVINIYIFLDL